MGMLWYIEAKKEQLQKGLFPPIEKYRGTSAVKKQSFKSTISSAGQIAKALLLCHTAHLLNVLHIPKAELPVKWVTENTEVIMACIFTLFI